MDFLSWFRYSEDSLLVHGSFSPWLVFLSLAIAIFTSIMAFQLIDQAKGRNHGIHQGAKRQTLRPASG